tara:strand:- start:180 stop:665 length:486 start_codon:yes stop_codon:yes gene_type:complete
MEIAVKEKGRVRWIKCDKSVIELLTNGTKVSSLPISSTEEFDKWYNLYSKKTTKKLAVAYWKKHITKKLIPKIMKHTKSYVEKTEKCYRLDPIRYLKNEKYNDEIIVTEKKVDLDESYPFDKSGSARLGRCNSCNGIVFGNKFTIHKDDSDCCQAKINKYR